MDEAFNSAARAADGHKVPVKSAIVDTTNVNAAMRRKSMNIVGISKSSLSRLLSFEKNTFRKASPIGFRRHRCRPRDCGSGRVGFIDDMGSIGKCKAPREPCPFAYK